MEDYYLILISVVVILHTMLIFLGLRMYSRLEATMLRVLENQDRGTTISATGLQYCGIVFAGSIHVTITQRVGLNNNPNLINMPPFQHTRLFPYIEDNPSFVGRGQHLKDLEFYTTNVPSRVVPRQGFVYWITGIEGVGKSRFAQRFIENLMKKKIRKEFLWFDCQHQQTLFEQFTEAAQANGIILRSIELGGIEQMYTEFSKYEIIIIFDNVQSYVEIEEYLPKNTFDKFTVIATCGYLGLHNPRRMSLTGLDRAESKELVYAVNSSNVAPLERNCYGKIKKLDEDAFKTIVKLSNGIPPILKDIVDFACSCAENQHVLGNGDYNVHIFLNTWERKKYLLIAEVDPIIITDRFTEIMRDLLASIERRAVTFEVQRAILQILMLVSFLLPRPNSIPQDLIFYFLHLDNDIYLEAVRLLRQHFILKEEPENRLYLQIYGPVQSSLAKVLWEDKREDFDDFLESFCSRMQIYVDQVDVITKIGQLRIRNCIHALKERKEKLGIEPEIDLVQCLVKRVRFIFPEKNISLDSSLDALAELFEPSAFSRIVAEAEAMLRNLITFLRNFGIRFFEFF